MRGRLLARRMSRALRSAGAPLAIDPYRFAAQSAPVIRQAEDPLRCRCPECLALDIAFPREGYQLALFPYEISRRSFA